MSIAYCSWTLVAFIAGGGAATPPPPIALAQAPISPEALHECKADELQKALSGAFRLSKRFRYLPDLDDTPIKIEILECIRLERVTRTFSDSRRPRKVPFGPGAGFGGEEDASLETNTTRWVTLRARIGTGARLLNVESDPKDPSLKVAAESLRREIDKALAEHGEWLLRGTPLTRSRSPPAPSASCSAGAASFNDFGEAESLPSPSSSPLAEDPIVLLDLALRFLGVRRRSRL